MLYVHFENFITLNFGCCSCSSVIVVAYIKIAPRSIASATYAVNHKGHFS